MARKSASQRILESKPSFVAVLEEPKAAKFKARTMLIPSPKQVRDAISTIPFGSSKSLKELRHELATNAGADITCPAAASRFWRLVAEASEEEMGPDQKTVPWWRVTKDGKPSDSLPGGAQRQRDLLLSEGIRL